MIKKIIEDIANVASCLSVNSMYLNNKKCNVLMISSKSKNISATECFTIDCENIHTLNEVK